MGNLQGHIGKLLTLLIALIFLTLGLNLMQDPLVDKVTTATTETATITGPTDTQTLTSQHFFTDTTQLTATGAIDGNMLVAATTTLGADRVTLTYQNASTEAQVVVVGYLAPAGETLDPLWRAIPFLIMIGVISTLMGTAFSAGTSISGANIGMKVLSGIIVVIVGAILTGVQDGFTSSAETAYALTPDFSGVALALPLVDLAYILAILAMVFGMMGGQGIVDRAKARFGA